MLTFKFSKKIPATIFKDNLFTYIVVDDKVNQYLKQNNDSILFEFENKKFQIQYNYLKKYNDMYFYEINNVNNQQLDISKSNIGYFYVSNLSFWEFIK